MVKRIVGGVAVAVGVALVLPFVFINCGFLGWDWCWPF